MKKILIAEDDDTNYLILFKFLDKLKKYELVRAENGDVTLEKLSKDDYDCLLLDMKMPFKNGLEITKLLRSQNNNILIIAVTASAMLGEKEIAITAGVNHYFTKPVEYDKLINLIQKLLD